jgi:hypothetical protein
MFYNLCDYIATKDTKRIDNITSLAAGTFLFVQVTKRIVDIITPEKQEIERERMGDLQDGFILL